jgi:two-component system chemotaxis response regulator CheY
MCSAMGQKTFVLEAIQNGAKDFLVKPLQKDKVHETLGKHLS